MSNSERTYSVCTVSRGPWPQRPLTIAWISRFPIGWLPDLPEPLRDQPRLHPAPWQRVLLAELEPVPEVKLHVISIQKHFPRSITFDQGKATFHCLKVPGGVRTLSRFWWDTLMLRHLFKRLQPDLVHAWGIERGSALTASRLKYPSLVTMHGLQEWLAQHVRFNFIERDDLRLERPSLERASVVTAESKFAVHWLRERYPHLEVHQAEHAPHWLFHRVQRHPLTQPLQFLYVGALCKLKGTDLLVQALDRLRGALDFRLTLVGAGLPEFMRRLRSLAPAEFWARVTMRGELTTPEIVAELARATIMIFPTLADNSPNSVKEAVVAGLPVVASAVGGIVDYVLPEQNGLLFQGGDLESLVNSIRAAASHPLLGSGKVDAVSLERMRNYLSPEAMRERFLAVYRRVVERARMPQ